MENTSGHGKSASIPPEIEGWNWGAFLLNWIWAIGNRTFIGLLMFLPLVGFVMPFVLGFKGSAWAWRNKRWESVEHFKRVQRLWTIWASVLDAALMALFVGVAYFAFSQVKNSEAYLQGVLLAQSNAEAVSILGPPIKTSLPKGSFEEYGPTGKASYSFDVEGRKASGTVYVIATKDLGIWKLNQAELAVEGREVRIDLIGSRPATSDAASPIAATKPVPDISPSVSTNTESAKSGVIGKPEAVAAPAPVTTNADFTGASPIVAPVRTAPRIDQSPVESGNTASASPESVSQRVRANSSRDADARRCLDLKDNAEIIKCSRAYR